MYHCWKVMDSVYCLWIIKERKYLARLYHITNSIRRHRKPCGKYSQLDFTLYSHTSYSHQCQCNYVCYWYLMDASCILNVVVNPWWLTFIYWFQILVYAWRMFGSEDITKARLLLQLNYGGSEDGSNVIPSKSRNYWVRAAWHPDSAAWRAGKQQKET